MSSYDSFKPNPGIGQNAHDDLKTTLSKIDTDSPNTPSKYGPRWEQNRHERLGSKLDLKYALGTAANSHANDAVDQSPRNSREIEKESSPMDHLNPRLTSERDRQEMYRLVLKLEKFK